VLNRMTTLSSRSKGISAALTSAFFLGLTPVFGKEAILMGIPPFTVVAFRTSMAAILLVIVVYSFYRKYLFIYPAGLLGCLLAGWINGIGSLFYYSALVRIDASIGHLLYSLYPLFLVLWLALDRQPPNRVTLIQITIAIPAIYLLTQSGCSQINYIGILEMLLASALYALHLPINQRVLYDIPAPTVTLYTLIAMSTVVVPVFLLSGQREISVAGFTVWPLLGLTLVTFLSRLMLFTGIKHLGGMQTALLGLSEMLVAVLFSNIWLGEKFNIEQWIGAILLMTSLALVGFDRSSPKRSQSSGWLSWLRPPRLKDNYPWQPDK
jgi:drug/metabolite transporter (DMT)-like permease